MGNAEEFKYHEPSQHPLDPLELIAAIPMPALITDARLPDNPVIASNGAFEQLTGYPIDETIGRNCRFLAGPETDATTRAYLHQAIADERPVVVRLLNYRRDGSKFMNALMIAPIMGKDGKAQYFLGTQLEVEQEGAASFESPPPAVDRVNLLSVRQREVLTYLAAGYRTKQIAHALAVSESTIKMHRRILFKRLGVHNSPEAARLAVQAGLPDLPPA